MAVNVISDQKKDPQKKVKVGNSRVLGWLSQWFNIERLTGEKQFPIKYIDGSLFLLVLGLITVFFRINAERQMRQLRRANEEVNNLRAGYTILKANYMKMGKQSELAPKVEKFGLKESRKTPQRIVVEE
jgi:hypothetical protein